MKQNLCVLVFIFLAQVTVAQASQCIPQKESDCTYYSCLNIEKGCSDSNYLIRFGEHYCNKFNRHADNFSKHGQTWINDVRYCLQNVLANQEKVKRPDGQKALTCDRIESFAYNSHVPCYVDNGFCDLLPPDQVALFDVVNPEALDIKTQYLFSEIVAECTFKNAEDFILGPLFPFIDPEILLLSPEWEGSVDALWLTDPIDTGDFPYSSL